MVVVMAIFPASNRGWPALRIHGVLAVLVLSTLPAAAADRHLELKAPSTAAAGEMVEIVASAATDFGHGEQIGFFHGEYSVDGGRTWTGICYDQALGPAATRRANLKAGVAGSELRVRVRVAFRDGLAGDVDFRGAAIRWHDSWEDWAEPPARRAVIRIVTDSGPR